MATLACRGSDAEVVIVGAGIGGLTLALCLERAGIACRVYGAAAEIAPLGVAIARRDDGAAEQPRRALGGRGQARRHQCRVAIGSREELP
jgi:2-polyprenyl-6-methoxyphenol hydroxylase-like FAD-dependent oxidoreductase